MSAALSQRPSPWHCRAFVVLAILLLLIAGRGWERAISERGNDLTIYLDAAAAMAGGSLVFDVDGYIYLPFFAALLACLAWLPVALQAAIWQLASWACAVGGLVGAARLVDPAGRWPWLGWVTTLVTLRLWDSNLSYGQANAFTFAALIGALHWIVAGRGGRAGALIGLAAAYKVLPGIGLVLLLVRRSVRGLGVGLATLVGLSLLVPPLFLGWAGSLDAHRDWFHVVAEPYLRGGQALLEARPYVAGQSLLASAYRTLAATPVTNSDPAARAALAELDPGLVHGVVRGLVAAHFLALLFALWRRRDRTDAESVAWAGGLTLCTALIAGPLVHKAHVCWAALGFAVCFARAADARSARARALVLVPLGLSTLLISATTALLWGTDSAQQLVSRNAIYLGVELLWLLLLYLGPPPPTDGRTWSATGHSRSAAGQQSLELVEVEH
ncbi:glycosyltransferase family 87 protein [Engelhardtia mirabilis]|uniref:DUF2029 domain-containing protein n=1 Tax=Engelhardtia mirabilis TaxID=2528011 RepID=A0A518BI36_9BACT|nr:hypothetical protein Pla133_17170 [Planctomycetes bacterium Pla133]QDV00967.1 hypothetical protein Pla86_17160 [Planctomycetes bacterium Pla86]